MLACRTSTKAHHARRQVRLKRRSLRRWAIALLALDKRLALNLRNRRPSLGHRSSCDRRDKRVDKAVLGFVVLSHNNPPQLRKLCDTLNTLYEKPPIAVHHDQSQSTVDRQHFSDNVAFVENPLVTGWGGWSVTEAVLKGLARLYQGFDPNWFTLLSAADYPVMVAESVRDVLRTTRADAFVDLHPLSSKHQHRHFGTQDPALAHHDNKALGRKRYLHARLDLGLLRPKKVGGNQTVRLPFASPFNPFTSSYQCYVGSQWLTGNRKTAERILRPSSKDVAYQRYLRKRWHADESYINTVIGNDPQLVVDVNPRRFTRWSDGGAHPETLTENDLDAARSAEAFFARKFAHGSAAVQALDRELKLL